ncbi:MAG TPA: hypothetical protein VKM54_03530 [Myxococcota bacterium]|nr:hypothetical protein [Myxococcota bacterium]
MTKRTCVDAEFAKPKTVDHRALSPAEALDLVCRLNRVAEDFQRFSTSRKDAMDLLHRFRFRFRGPQGIDPDLERCFDVLCDATDPETLRGEREKIAARYGIKDSQ